MSLSSKRLYVGVAAVALLARLAVLALLDLTYDDAFIVLRVARNAALGQGLVFNPGERVQAVTSLPYTVFVSALWRIFDAQSLGVVRALACSADAASAVVIARMTLRALAPGFGVSRAPPWQHALGAIAAAAFYLLFSRAFVGVPAGLETAFYVLALLLALDWTETRHFSRAAIAATGAALLRPEGSLVLVVVFLFAALHRRARQVAAICVPCLLAFWWAQWSYYGSIIPQTVIAKHHLFAEPIREWKRVIALFAWPKERPLLPFLQALSALAGGVWCIQHEKNRPLLAWCAAYVVAISTFAKWWDWYFIPAAAPFAVCFGVGLARLPAVIPWGGRRVAHVAAVALSGLLLAGAADATYRRVVELAAFYPTYQSRLLAVGRWLREHAEPGERALLEPLGVVGYESQLPIDDYPGLCSPQVTDIFDELGLSQVGHTPRDSSAAAPVIERIKPSYLVLRREELRALEQTDALSPYRTVFSVPWAAAADPPFPRQSLFVLKRSQGERAR